MSSEQNAELFRRDDNSCSNKFNSRPVTPTRRDKKPFGENVEGHFSFGANDMCQVAVPSIAYKMPIEIGWAEVTPTQGRYLAYIRAYTDGVGLPPAESEIADTIGVSPPSVNQMMKTLEKKGISLLVEQGRLEEAKLLAPQLMNGGSYQAECSDGMMLDDIRECMEPVIRAVKTASGVEAAQWASHFRRTVQ